METRKLYYEDCHLTTFHARVLSCVCSPGGYLITLDATAFYPEGGGQACDWGKLGDVSVFDVQEGDEGIIIHMCTGPLEVGQTVEGVINWERRFDQMQQHTGEHIVSGIVHCRWGYDNVGFHVGKDVMTVDFDGPIPAQELAWIEAEANKVVRQNLPLRCWYPSPEELPTVGYRTKKALPWPVRIVEIPGVDKCACCGVQVAATGEVGVIKLLSCVKFHQGVRIEMACGGRALAILNTMYDQNRQVSQAFSAKMPETGEAAREMNRRLAAAEYRINELQRQIFDTVAAGYAGKGDVLHFQEGLTPVQVRELADRIASVCGGTAFVCSGEDGSYAVCLVNKSGAVSALSLPLKETFGAKGGGKPGCFQGTLPAARAEIETFFHSR